ncbi:DUF4062 domain-containing protein [Clostridiaceae bacterium AF31-3BH]|nr:DUF4062 domain-containing protein [Clostridiaceae bacterium AF31-3BH]
MSIRTKYQCFVSSTYEDLGDERQACATAILKANHIPAGMEYFHPTSEMKGYIENWIIDSDIVFLILGGRYGSIDLETGLSFTEWEYRVAKENKKEVIILFLSESYLLEKLAKFRREKLNILVFEQKHEAAYEKFKEELMEDKGLHQTIDNLFEIENTVTLVLSDIARRTNEQKQGWIRYNPETILDVAEADLENISESNRRKLFKELIKRKIASADIDSDRLGVLASDITRLFDQYNEMTRKYLTRMTRRISIILFDDYIKIVNSTNMTYYQKDGGKHEMKFSWNPWLHPGREVESYKIHNVKYNGEFLDAQECVTKGKPQQTQNPFYVTDVIKLEIPFDRSKEEHQIQYESVYHVDYDRFFHERVFKELCKGFTLEASLEDKRTNKKDKEYMIKWSIFTMHEEQDFVSRNMLNHHKNNIFCNPVEIMLPGSGYILTLGSAKTGVIKGAE